MRKEDLKGGNIYSNEHSNGNTYIFYMENDYIIDNVKTATLTYCRNKGEYSRYDPPNTNSSCVNNAFKSVYKLATEEQILIFEACFKENTLISKSLIEQITEYHKNIVKLTENLSNLEKLTENYEKQI